MYKMNGKSRLIFIPAASAAVILIAVVVFIVPTLPGRLDEILLTNDDFCLGDVSWHVILFGFNYGGSNNHSESKIHIDYGDYIHKIDFDVEEGTGEVNKGNRSEQFRLISLWKKIIDYSLWRIALHFFGNLNREDHVHFDNSSVPHSSSKLHPLCGKYRQFRSRLRFQSFLIPWNWYYRCTFQVRKLTLHAAENTVFMSRAESKVIIAEYISKLMEHLWNVCASFFKLDSYYDVLRVDSIDILTGHSERLSHLHDNFLPPALEVDDLEISFRSWSRPVVSANIRGIKLNVVMQPRASPINLPFQISGNSDDHNGNEFCPIDELSIEKRIGPPVLIGDMTILEALRILPKPPKKEGLYPRIGVLNVTNAIISVYFTDGDSSLRNGVINSTSTLSLLAKIQVPEKIFFPILNVTEANKARGIDQFHFQPLLEDTFSNTFRDHLLQEVEDLLRGSWMKAAKLTENLKQQTAKATDQLQQLILKIQELYLERLNEMSINAWRQTREMIVHSMYKANGIIPLIEAFEDWLEDLRGMVTEPIHPLKRLIMQHFNNVSVAFVKHDILSLIGGSAWEKYSHNLKHALDEMVTKSLDIRTRKWKDGLVIEKKIPDHLNEIQAFFDDLISKSQRIDLKNILEYVEHEMDIFLDSLFFE